VWLAYEGDEVVGFCGLPVYDELEPLPHLLYALRERASGRGFAHADQKFFCAHAGASSATDMPRSPTPRSQVVHYRIARKSQRMRAWVRLPLERLMVGSRVPLRAL
jgi:hypothetical protein